jgi:hypothetical protein
LAARSSSIAICVLPVGWALERAIECEPLDDLAGRIAQKGQNRAVNAAQPRLCVLLELQIAEGGLDQNGDLDAAIGAPQGNGRGLVRKIVPGFGGGVYVTSKYVSASSAMRRACGFMLFVFDTSSARALRGAVREFSVVMSLIIRPKFRILVAFGMSPPLAALATRSGVFRFCGRSIKAAAPVGLAGPLFGSA